MFQPMVSLSMYHKKIYDINALDQEYDIVFYDTYFGRSDIDISDKAHRARVLNPDVDKENIVIWGSGITGERAYKIITDNGMQVRCFIDSNKKLEGAHKCGLPIYPREQLEEVGRDLIVIEAMEKWDELDRKIQGKYEKRFYYYMKSDEIRRSITVMDGTTEKRLFNLGNFWMFHYFTGKRIYIYGTGVVEKEFVKYLKLLDYDFAGFLTDEYDKEEEGNYQVKYVEEILYEEERYIWLYDKKKAPRLKALGLEYFKEYYVNRCNWDVTMKERIVLDINLGHTYLSESGYPGITVYGNEKEDNFKIAILGSSTTDETAYPFKSWPQLLYEELSGRAVTVYNGGVGSYTAGQEVIKLIRDLLQLKPDMVIVYDGYNDLNIDLQYPFIFPSYLEKVFKYAKIYIEEDDNDNYLTGHNIPICKGIAFQQDRFSNWIYSIRSMYAVTSERNIPFFAFCQPMLSSKKSYTAWEKNMLLSMLRPELSLQRQESFRQHMLHMTDKPEYLYDLSDIFDEEDNIYMDAIHVCEMGNKIIAREIYKVILPVIEEFYREG